MKTEFCNYISIGERIKQARKAKRYTQAQVAEMIDMSSKNFSQLERGMTGMSLQTLTAICKALDTSADYLLFGMSETYQKSTIGKLLSGLTEKQQINAEKLLQAYVDAVK